MTDYQFTDNLAEVKTSHDQGRVGRDQRISRSAALAVR
jgi:hypothetical protein